MKRLIQGGLGFLVVLLRNAPLLPLYFELEQFFLQRLQQQSRMIRVAASRDCRRRSSGSRRRFCQSRSGRARNLDRSEERRVGKGWGGGGERWREKVKSEKRV